MKKTPLVLAGLLILALAGAFFLYQTAQREIPDGWEESTGRSILSVGTTAPSYSLKDMNGDVVDSSDFWGKPTVINFFTTWCPPCIEEMPGLVDVYNKYKDKGFELVGISLDTDTRKDLPAFVLNHRIPFRILLGDLATTRAYGGISSLPTTIFIGKDGRIRNVHVGYLDRDTLDSEVRKLL